MSTIPGKQIQSSPLTTTTPSPLSGYEPHPKDPASPNPPGEAMAPSFYFVTPLIAKHYIVMIYLPCLSHPQIMNFMRTGITTYFSADP